MGRLAVRPFTPADLPAAAEIAATRHRLARQRLPMLAAALEDVGAWEALLAARLQGRRTEGVVAVRDGRVAGFLVGEEMLFAPDHFASQFIPPHSVDMPVDGQGVAAGEDVLDVYRGMYAELARRWVERGLFTHRVHLVPDAEVQEAWVTLGFGRHLTAAVRETASPVPGPFAHGVEVHQASAEDIDVVMALAGTLNRHHHSAPIFWPILPAPQTAAREYNLGHLADPDANPYFIAYLQGRPVAMQTFNNPGFIPPVVEREGNLYLFEGVVEPDLRAGGVGAALLHHTMAHLREHGYRWCTLHWASPNPTGAPFWQKHQFIPVEHEMERRVDERIAWARA